jgi:hypothetical protein
MSQSPQPAIQSQAPDLLTPANTLADLEHDSWQQLALAAEQSQHGFNTMVVASCTPAGADARTVVLRKVDANRKYVWFHTDARAAKVMQFGAFPHSTLLFWDDKRQCQLRLSAETHLHTDDYVADEHWQNLWIGGRKTYLSEQTPGSEQARPYPGFPEHFGEDLPSEEASEAGRKNFAVIECRVLAVDYLHLSRSGQTRARFQYEPESKLVWLAP